MHKHGKRCRRGRKGLFVRIYMSEIHGECVEGHAPGSYREVATLSKRQGNVVEIREKERYSIYSLGRVLYYIYIRLWSS